MNKLFSTTHFYILLSLSDGKRHGYGITQFVEAESKGKVILGPGTLYGSIKRLLAAGLIREVQEKRDAKTDRRYYELTAAGRTELTSYAEQLQDMLSAHRRGMQAGAGLHHAQA